MLSKSDAPLSLSIVSNMSTTQTRIEKPKAEAEQTPTIATSPRKRRRRAAATGAADDCFACQERRSKCDRRRPYCTPCLDVGKDCSGYKTALTWGVGVASRGKLRGLSLPISTSKRAAPASDDEPEKLDSPPKKLTKLGPTRKPSVSKSPGFVEQRATSATTSTTASTPTNYGFVNMDPASTSSGATSASYTQSNFQWRRPASLSHTRNIKFADKKPRRHTLQPLHVSAPHPARDYGIMPMTASIVGGYGHHDFGLSSQISPMVPNFAGYEISSPVSKDFAAPTSAPYDSTSFGHAQIPWTNGPYTPSLSSEHGSQHGVNDVPGYFAGVGGMLDVSITNSSTEAEYAIDPKYQTLGGELPPLVADDVGDHSALPASQPMPPMHVMKSPKLQSLIEYYRRNISPTVVALDGPYDLRAYILHLANESGPLQHAIATLAASNPPTRSRVEISLSQDSRNSGSASETSALESYHKSEALRGIVTQLGDQNHRKDDAALASLLILCLYHTYEIGVAELKMQYADVTKLLTCCGGTTNGNSISADWLTLMLSWFGRMSANSNDWRSKPRDSYATDTAASSELTFENFAGCDGHLFDIISKVGHINMLSKNETLAQNHRRSSASITTPPLPVSSSKDYYSIRHSTLESPTYTDTESNSHRNHQGQAGFWSLWASIRQQLYNWSFSSPIPPLSGSSGIGAIHRESFHISEAFRYAALIYLERLASPSLPLTHPTFQNLTTQAAYHIQRIEQDIFLLWPLFITANDILEPSLRQMARERCWGLQRQSGMFQSLNTLEMLKRIWRDDIEEARPVTSVVNTAIARSNTNDHGTQGSEQLPLQQVNGLTGLSPGEFCGDGFRWRKAMEKANGEYIIV